jgi:hypothetical protein
VKSLKRVEKLTRMGHAESGAIVFDEIRYCPVLLDRSEFYHSLSCFFSKFHALMNGFRTPGQEEVFSSFAGPQEIDQAPPLLGFKLVLKGGHAAEPKVMALKIVESLKPFTMSWSSPGGVV